MVLGVLSNPLLLPPGLKHRQHHTLPQQSGHTGLPECAGSISPCQAKRVEELMDGKISQRLKLFLAQITSVSSLEGWYKGEDESEE